MKPAVVPLAIGFTAGVAAGLSFAEGWLLAPAAGLAAVALWGVRGAMRVVLFMAVGLALGAVHGAAARAARVRDCRLGWADGARVSLEVEPVGLSFGRSRMVRATGECGGQVRIVSRDSLAAGAAVVGTWRRAPVSTLRRLARPDQAGVLMVDSVRNWGPGLSLRSRLRLGAERRLLELFGERRFGVAAALSTSPGIQLDEGEHARYRAAGLAHLLSISGFHVGVLAAALVLVLRAARSSPGGAQLGALGVVALYVWLLGWPAPALRAGVLLAFWTWARLRQRPPDSAGLLAGCALLVLAADAWSVLAPGAWLSFAGAWGCAAAARQLQAVRREVTGRRLRALLRRARPVAISTGAVVATSPFTILFFGGVAPIAVAANLFAVPAAAAAVPALALALALSAVPLLSAGAWVPAGAAGLALDALDVVARAAAAVPGALVPVGPRLSGAVVAAT
ncbi:MAG TPA: ComEC/Rec2 family competence protein, partial [Gemmatimonadales bacterium]|nr:ComEC/Rec2 family competence protein [Gemmatimonadales bacterium]